MLSLLLAVLGVAAFPCWRYSARWGYAPSMTVGFLLVLMAALTIGGKPLTDDGRLARFNAPPAHVPEVRIATATDDVEKAQPGPP